MLKRTASQDNNSSSTSPEGTPSPVKKKKEEGEEKGRYSRLHILPFDGSPVISGRHTPPLQHHHSIEGEQCLGTIRKVDSTGLLITSAYAMLSLSGFRPEYVFLQHMPMHHIFVSMVLDHWKPLFLQSSIGCHHAQIHLGDEKRQLFTINPQDTEESFLVWRAPPHTTPLYEYLNERYQTNGLAQECPIFPPHSQDGGRLLQSFLPVLVWRLVCGMSRLEAAQFLVSAETTVHSINECNAFTETLAPVELWDHWHMPKKLHTRSKFFLTMPESRLYRGLQAFKKALRPHKAELQRIGLMYQRGISVDMLRARANAVTGQSAFRTYNSILEGFMIPYVMRNLESFGADISLFLDGEGLPVAAAAVEDKVPSAFTPSSTLLRTRSEPAPHT
jgi:hypothetical protein